jgi:hypothetical protein
MTTEHIAKNISTGSNGNGSNGSNNMAPAVVENKQQVKKYEADKARSPFEDSNTLAHNYRIATVLAESDMVPMHFRNTRDNSGMGTKRCMIALDYAYALKVNVHQLMGEMTFVKGRAGIGSKLLTALLNKSGKFGIIQYEERGNINRQVKDKEGTTTNLDDGCRVYAVDKESGITVRGPWVTWHMVIEQGWCGVPDRHGRLSSKWDTGMSNIMFWYRAAAFFVRMYASELQMGFITSEELEDINNNDQTIQMTAVGVKEERPMIPLNEMYKPVELPKKEEKIGDNDSIKKHHPEHTKSTARHPNAYNAPPENVDLSGKNIEQKQQEQTPDAPKITIKTPGWYENELKKKYSLDIIKSAKTLTRQYMTNDRDFELVRSECERMASEKTASSIKADNF